MKRQNTDHKRQRAGDEDVENVSDVIPPLKRKRIDESNQKEKLVNSDSRPEMEESLQFASTTTDQQTSFPRLPDLKIADMVFTCTKNPQNEEMRAALMNEIKANSMLEVYRTSCAKLPGWSPLDKVLMADMKSSNESELESLQAKITDAEENLGVTEIRNAIIAKLQFLCKSGDFQKAIALIKESAGKKAFATLSSKLDLKFYHIRCLMFDFKRMRELYDVVVEARVILEESGAADWDRKNRLKAYEALVAFHTKRDFATATKLFLEILPTYNCYEILNHKTFVSYTVLFAMISLERPDLRDKIVKNSEIRQVLYSDPETRNFLNSLFECRYADFFQSLAIIEQSLKKNRIWHVHYRYYTSELKIIAYRQQMESYSSMSLRSLAQSFGVTEEFIDSDISRLIANGRLKCKIDKVNGHVNDFRLDEKNAQYQDLLKKGDLLLARIQKLSRVISL